MQAIKKFNGQKLQNRTIAVDWAVPKNLYKSGNSENIAPEDGNYLVCPCTFHILKFCTVHFFNIIIIPVD